jgi:hypothetical protein
MRWLAIAVNLVQIGTILGLFLTKGLTLGGSTIMVFFVLLLFALINLIVLLFYTINTAADQPLFGREKAPIVKRQDLRVSYVSGLQPVFSTGKQRFSLLDLAENGLRISLDRNTKCRKHLSGQIALLCGTTLNVKGILARREGDEAALLFKKPVDYQVLLQERQAVQAGEQV